MNHLGRVFSGKKHCRFYNNQKENTCDKYSNYIFLSDRSGVNLKSYIHIYSLNLYIKNYRNCFFIILVLCNDGSFVATSAIKTFEITIDCYHYSKWHDAHLVFLKRTFIFYFGFLFCHYIKTKKLS